MKTYSHLQHLKRMPTEYEVVTTGLLYYPERGFETDVPTKGWYERYQKGSAFQCSDWEKFADPRETTYTRYVTLQRTQESYLDGLLESIESSGYDTRLSGPALDLLEQFFAPLRYPLHGLQMASAYVGQMAPGGRIVFAALQQTADEIRRVQRIAYRLALLRRVRPSIAERSRQRWEQDAAWQPLRETVEKLLATYDWGEALVALNLVVKPAVDDLLSGALSDRARALGDYQLGEFFGAFRSDVLWQRSWTDSLFRVAVADRPENAPFVDRVRAIWQPRADAAVQGLANAMRGAS